MEHEKRHDRIGEAIRARRKSLRLTQTQVADLSGVGVVFVRAVERGKPTVRLDHLARLLSTLGLRLELRDGGGGLGVVDGL